MANNVEKREFKMKEMLALWLNKSKNGQQYLAGKSHDGAKVVGFLNGKKKNPKEPDVRIHLITGEEMQKEAFLSMWVNVSKSDKKYLTGKIGEHRVVGFIYDGENKNAPYIKVYLSEETAQKKQEKDQVTLDDVVTEVTAEELPF